MASSSVESPIKVNLLKKTKFKGGRLISNIMHTFDFPIEYIYKIDVVSITYMPSDIKIIKELNNFKLKYLSKINVQLVPNNIINIEYEMITKNFFDEKYCNYIVKLQSDYWGYIVLNHEVVISKNKNEIVDMFCKAGNISIEDLDKMKLQKELNLSLKEHQLNEIHKVKI